MRHQRGGLVDIGGSLILISLWLVPGMIGAGLINASMRKVDGPSCEKFSAKDQSLSILIGGTGGPIALVLALGMSGFGYSGWTLLRKPCP